MLNVKLGKKPPRHDLRTLHLIDYICGNQLPSPPPARDWADKLPEDMGVMMNEQYGDCGFAGQAHGVQCWTSEVGSVVTIPDNEVLAAYSGCTGFNPSDPSTDNGVVLLDALNYWRNTGIGGHKILAYVKVDQHNMNHLKIALDLFGGLYTGSNLPVSAQNLPAPWIGKTGNLTGDDAPGSWGGHCMWMSSYNNNMFTFITWGKRQQADAQWILNYTDECYAVLSMDWVNGAKQAPSGFNLSALQADLSKL